MIALQVFLGTLPLLGIIIVGGLLNNKRFDRIEKRLEAIEATLLRMEGRLDTLAEQLSKIEGKIGAIEL